MANKDFSKVKTSPVYSTIAEATADPAPQPIPKRKRDTPPTAEEIQLARETPEIHEYIRTMAQVRGQTVTQFTEAVFRKSMEDNAEIYEQVKAFQKIL